MSIFARPKLFFLVGLNVWAGNEVHETIVMEMTNHCYMQDIKERRVCKCNALYAYTWEHVFLLQYCTPKVVFPSNVETMWNNESTGADLIQGISRTSLHHENKRINDFWNKYICTYSTQYLQRLTEFSEKIRAAKYWLHFAKDWVRVTHSSEGCSVSQSYTYIICRCNWVANMTAPALNRILLGPGLKFNEVNLHEVVNNI